MSDQDASKGKVSAWTEREVLVYLLCAIDHTGVKIDFANAPAPVGRNTSGCLQKMSKLKRALQADIDAVKNGQAIVTNAPADATPKKATPRKRKVATDENGDATPKKRGRPKKAITPEVEEEEEAEIKVKVKGEPEGEQEVENEV